MFKGKNKFIGERIYLRTLTEEDANVAYCGWLNDLKVNKFLATKGVTMAELKAYIKDKNSQRDILFLGIFLKNYDKFIGTIKLGPIDLVLRKSNIATMLGDKNYWGQGLTLEAMNLLISYCFKDLKLKEVYLGVIKQNLAAKRVYEKAGFIPKVGIFDMSVNYDNKKYNQITMSLTREAWLANIKK